MTLEGGDFRRLTFSGANYDPAWSPDGEQIAFYSIRGQGAAQNVMNADGGEGVCQRKRNRRRQRVVD